MQNTGGNRNDGHGSFADIPRLYTALAEWLACLVCLLEVRRRITGKKFALAAFGIFVVQASFLTLTPGLENLLWILCMAAAIGMMYFFIYICGGLNGGMPPIIASVRLCWQSSPPSLEWQIHCHFLRRYGLFPFWLALLLLALVYSAIFTVYAKLYHKAGYTPLNITNRELLSYTIIGLAIFFMSNLGFVSTGTLFGGSYAAEIYNVRTLVDLGGVAVMYAYHVQRVDLRMRYELESVQSILHNQHVQYKQAR